MAALDFPDTPAVGQLYGSSGTVWRWDGARWASTAGASGARGMVAYKDIQAPQSGITTEVLISGLAVAWTAIAGRIYRIRSYLEISSTVAGDAPLVYVRGPSATIWGRMATPIVNTGISEQFYTEYVTGGLSGAQTAQVSVQRAIGTGSLSIAASGNYPAFIMVEDITYEAGSGGPGIGTLPKGIRAMTRIGNGWDTGAIGGSFTQLNGLGVAVDVLPGRAYKITAVGTFFLNNTNGIGNIAIRRVWNASQLAMTRQSMGPNFDPTRMITVEHIYLPTVAMNEGFNVYAAFDTGTMDHRPTDSNPAWIAVEDLGVWPPQ